MKLTEHFTLEELCASDLVNKRNSDANPKNNINNTPSPEALNTLSLFCRAVLEPLRKLLNQPIHISSGFRCEALNIAVGGADNSQHTIGQAADIYVDGIATDTLFEIIRTQDVFTYGQCICEHLHGKNWVHVSFGSRRENMIADHKDEHGKTVYQHV